MIPENDILVSFRKSEIASLSHDLGGITDSSTIQDDGAIERIIVGNTARGSAVQLLGPVGMDLWEDVRVRIENNTVSGQATQLAYPTDFASFKYLLDHQARMAVLEKR
jgi:hypothetical protein